MITKINVAIEPTTPDNASKSWGEGDKLTELIAELPVHYTVEGITGGFAASLSEAVDQINDTLAHYAQYNPTSNIAAQYGEYELQLTDYDTAPALDTLQDITGQESGIVLYDGGDMLICNWSSINGLPQLDPIGFALLGLGDELTVDDNPQDIPDIGAWLDDRNHNLIYDINDDYPQLHGQSGKLYNVSGAQVIAPDLWN